MNVIKRDGTSEPVQFDKVLERIRKAAIGLDPAVNYTRLAQLVLAEIHDGVRTTELDELAARMAVSYMTIHPDWGTLAAQIIVSNCQRSAPVTFSAAMEELATLTDANGRPVPAIAADVAEFVRANAATLDAMVRPENDFMLDYFGFKTLEKAYLMRGRGRRVVETPQYMWLRVAVGMWGSTHDLTQRSEVVNEGERSTHDLTQRSEVVNEGERSTHDLAHVNEGGVLELADRLTNIRETYELMSTKAFTHATPTLFNSSTPRPQLSSCFLVSMAGDSIDGIFDTLKQCAQISKYAGGIGLHVHNIRAQGTPIAGTQGTSNGIVPMLRVFNNTARYVDQCFPADTLIYTSNRGNIRIADIQSGDYVFTSGGSETVDETGKHFVKGPRGLGFDTVRKLVTHTYSGTMYHLTFSSGTTVTVTPQHPFLIKQSSGEWDYVEAEKLYIGAETTSFTVTNITTSTVINETLYDLEVDGTHDYTVQGAGIVHNGGGRRNGSFAIYLEPWHADIQSFLKMKSNTGSEEERARDLFYALWIPDLFMRRVESGGDWSLFCPHEAPGLADVHGAEFDALYTRYEAEGRAKRTVPAQKLWSDILVSQIETGTPYLLYKDAANAKSNQKNLGTIKSSNLCVAPETLILTDKGHVPIKDLEGQKVKVWNGEKWSETTVCKTGENQCLIRVILSNGASLECTPYHKFILNSKNTQVRLPNGNKKYIFDSINDAIRIDAKDLQTDTQLIKWSAPIVEGLPENNIKYPYTHGFFCGDGTVGNGGTTPLISLYGEKKQLIPYLDIRTSSGIDDNSGRRNVFLFNDISPKFTVPINATIENKLLWFAGLADADGTIVHNYNSYSIQIGSINKQFLNDIRLLLITLGIQSKVRIMREESICDMPDGRGGVKAYRCQSMYRLIISANGVRQLLALGFSPKRLIIGNITTVSDRDRFVKVVDVIDEGRMDDTYCFNEPENHAGVFNGVLAGNCTEILEYSSPDETAVCNLASIALPYFVDKQTKTFDFDRLRAVTKVIVRNLNRVIDINYYPTPETRRSNMRHRPVGLGVQGLADVFAMLGLAWETPEAATLNQTIFEHIYFAALERSAELATTDGPYSSFAGSPSSKGLLQPDLWSLDPATYKTATTLDWTGLRTQIKTTGLRNSLLVAPMPTASTSQILGYNETVEPFTSNIYVRRTLAGEFTIVNRHLVADLMAVGLWSEELKNHIVAANGSIQGLPTVPADIKARYKTVWEIKQKTLIDMAADRGAFVCQSQSLNLFVQDPTIAKLSSMHFYGWKKGLKTGIYYLRTKSAVQAIKFTVDPGLLKRDQLTHQQGVDPGLVAAQKAVTTTSQNNGEAAECLLCSS